MTNIVVRVVLLINIQESGKIINVVIITVSFACRDFLKVLMLLPVLFNCTVLKVGYSVIVNFSACMYLNPIFSQPFYEANCALLF